MKAFKIGTCIAIAFLLCGCGMNHAQKVASVSAQMHWLKSSHPYGSTCIQLETDDLVLYLDPVDLLHSDPLPAADIILISHVHSDHFSPQTIAKLSTSHTVILCSDTSAIADSLAGVQFYGLSAGDRVELNDLLFETVAAHGSAYHDRDLRGIGFLFTIDDVNIYLSGDTGLNEEVQKLRDIDIAVLNVRNPYCLSGEDVVRFAEIAKPQIIIPNHWMPDDDNYGDKAEIEYIRKNIAPDVEFRILDPE